MVKKVTIIIGSESDKNIADKTTEVLDKFAVPYDLFQASAHREPAKVKDVVANSGADVFICIAGLAAALPGVVASLTPKPVIGVPKDVKLGGLDALLSISQMPSGVPVATVGIDNGKNAAYLAIRILGLQYPEVLQGSGPLKPMGSSESSWGSSSLGSSPPLSESSSSSSWGSSSPSFGEDGSSESGSGLAMFGGASIGSTMAPPAEEPKPVKRTRATGDWG